MAKKHMPVTGGCLCGAIRYESTEPVRDSGYCHCEMCKKATGGLFFVRVDFPESTFKVTKGQIEYARTSKIAQRGFCADCGTPLALWYEGDAQPCLSIGSLDHPSDWAPTKHGYVEDKVSWYEIADDLPKHPKDIGYIELVESRLSD